MRVSLAHQGRRWLMGLGLLVLGCGKPALSYKLFEHMTPMAQLRMKDASYRVADVEYKIKYLMAVQAHFQRTLIKAQQTQHHLLMLPSNQSLRQCWKAYMNYLDYYRKSLIGIENYLQSQNRLLWAEFHQTQALVAKDSYLMSASLLDLDAIAAKVQQWTALTDRQQKSLHILLRTTRGLWQASRQACEGDGFVSDAEKLPWIDETPFWQEFEP